jgi:hypothetical protein
MFPQRERERERERNERRSPKMNRTSSQRRLHPRRERRSPMRNRISSLRRVYPMFLLIQVRRREGGNLPLIFPNPNQRSQRSPSLPVRRTSNFLFVPKKYPE